jgi:hypothetical protein
MLDDLLLRIACSVACTLDAFVSSLHFTSELKDY